MSVYVCMYICVYVHAGVHVRVCVRDFLNANEIWLIVSLSLSLSFAEPEEVI